MIEFEFKNMLLFTENYTIRKLKRSDFAKTIILFNDKNFNEAFKWIISKDKNVSNYTIGDLLLIDNLYVIESNEEIVGCLQVNNNKLNSANVMLIMDKNHRTLEINNKIIDKIVWFLFKVIEVDEVYTKFLLNTTYCDANVYYTDKFEKELYLEPFKGEEINYLPSIAII